MTDAVRELVDQNEIVETITRLFVGTDQRDWNGVESCFADSVEFDMTSLVGGRPRRLTPSEITAEWDQGLRSLGSIHHQVGNFLVNLLGEEAVALCYGIASHYRHVRSGRNMRTYVGSYNFHLTRYHGHWRIDSFRFNVKFVDGKSRSGNRSSSG